MVDNETIESYLIQMDIPFEQLRDGLWRLSPEDEGAPPVILSHEEPVVYLRLKVMDVPAGVRADLYRKLLELNADGLAFGAYAIEHDSIVLLDTLRSESLDRLELQASLESLILAAQQHYPELSPMLHGEE